MAMPALQARFNPLIRSYLLLSVTLVLCLTVIGIPLAALWLLGIGQWWTGRYFNGLVCELDADTLRFRKGIVFQIEKTIPLENIQDVTFVEGPLLRHFELSTLKFETAGSSGAQSGASDMQLTGIIGAADFRQEILRRRNRLRDQQRGTATARSDDPQLQLLQKISDQLDQLLALQRQRG